jgi:Protein of unknown function (DUF3738)
MDKTGRTGNFDLGLEWSPDASRPSLETEAPAHLTAVQEQLGLRLKATKAPVDVVVIDALAVFYLQPRTKRVTSGGAGGKTLAMPVSEQTLARAVGSRWAHHPDRISLEFRRAAASLTAGAVSR